MAAADISATSATTSTAGVTAGMSEFTALKKSHHTSSEGTIRGLCVDLRARRLVVRTDAAACPLQVYDYDGELLGSLGEAVPELLDTLYRDVSWDARRSLYLCPVRGAILLLNAAGKVTDKVSVGSEPRGICYCEEQDIYVVSDSSTNKVYVVDAARRQVVREFGGHGSGDGEFSHPENVHVGHVTGISQPVILVSDWNNHRVKLHDLQGHHLKTYGSRGEGPGHLDGPYGVTTDPAGRLVVCDWGNDRVTSFWCEEGEDQWRCLLDSGEIGSVEPWFVACDPEARVLAVSTFADLHVFSE